VDAGVKAISGERGLPSVLGFDGLRVTALHAEHAPIEVVDRGAVPKVGEKIQIRVHYHDGTVHLHPEMYGIRNQVVEDVFPIEH
jgi:D-serine deaminase-like pyridoxal phosphate-dependent protein